MVCPPSRTVPPPSDKKLPWPLPHSIALREGVLRDQVYNEARILQTRDPQLKVSPGMLVVRIFTSWKNPSILAGFEPANLGSRGEHVSPSPPRPICIAHYINVVILRCKPLMTQRTSLKIAVLMMEGNKPLVSMATWVEACLTTSCGTVLFMNSWKHCMSSAPSRWSQSLSQQSGYQCWFTKSWKNGPKERLLAITIQSYVRDMFSNASLKRQFSLDQNTMLRNPEL